MVFNPGDCQPSTAVFTGDTAAIVANRYDVSGLCGSPDALVLQVSANDAAVESILRAAGSTGLDVEAQINLLKVAAKWLEATTVLCRYATSVQRGSQRPDYVSH